MGSQGFGVGAGAAGGVALLGAAGGYRGVVASGGGAASPGEAGAWEFAGCWWRPALCAVCLLSAAVPARPAARLRGWAGVLGPDGFQGWGALASVGLLRWLGRWFLVWFRFRGVSVLLPCLALLSVVLCCLVSGARGSVLLCGAVSGFSCHACSLTASCHRVTQLQQSNLKCKSARTGGALPGPDLNL